jgi:hypothetical protein
MAENHRHRAPSSRSVNSYWPGPERHPDSAADLRLRIISGKGMTFACSDNSSNFAPTHRAPRQRGGDPHSSRRRQSPIRQTPIRQFPTPLWYRRSMNRKREFLPSTFRIPIDTVSAQGTAGRIQSSTDLESIEPKATAGFSPPLCPLGHSGKKATSCETAGYRTTGILRSAGLDSGKGGAAVKAASSYCATRATAATGSIVTGIIPARLMSS